jgi:hypothetical protein
MPWNAIWSRGAEPPGTGAVYVSMNDYLIYRALDVPRVAAEGMRLWWGWPRVPGTLGLCVAIFKTARRHVSISVWQTARDLAKFVHSADHLRIMHTYRGVGALYTHAWSADRFDRDGIWEEARVCLEGKRAGVRHH